jgi:hypothetical protein
VSNIVKETIVDCEDCHGSGVVQVCAGCGAARCSKCEGRGFFYLTLSRQRLALPSGSACEHGQTGGERKTSQKQNLGVIVCLIFGVWLAGCASRPAVRPSACECRDLAAQVEAKRAADVLARSIDDSLVLLEAKRAADVAVVLTGADMAADVKAHPEQTAREGEAVFKLGELQERIEGLVKP